VLEVTLPVVGMKVSVIALIGLGVAVGFVSAFFGVGGGIISVPMLNILFGIPYNFTVGTSPAVIFGTTISGTLSHRRLAHVDHKLGLFMIAGAMVGVECGARVVEALKHTGNLRIAAHDIQAVNFVLPSVYAVILVVMGILFFRESVRRRRQLRTDPNAPFVAPLSQKVQSALWAPRISLPASGIKQISIWTILIFGLTEGFVAGLLGIGGGIVLVPVFIYLMGVPTAVAIGTSVFEIMFASGLATFSHASKGNCDLVLAACLLVGSTLGAQLGAYVTRKLRGVYIRQAFGILACCTAIVVVVKLLSKLALI